MAEDRGPWLSVATALFFAWAFLSCCVRVWVSVGRKQSWGHADTGIVGAILIAVLHVAANFWAIESGYGRPLSETGESRLGDMQKALYMSQLSYLGSIGLTRVSMAFFVGQLTRHPPQVLRSYILAGVSGLWTAAAILIVALRPPVARPWSTMDGTNSLYHRWIAVEASGLVIEACLWLLSISLVWGLQMKLKKRLLILAIFGFRLLLIPIIAARLFYLSLDENYNPTVTSILPHILTEGAMDFAIISTTITALKPFLKPFHTGVIVNTVGGTGSGIYSGSRSGAPAGLYMLASVSKNKKGTGQTTTTSLNSDTTRPKQKLYMGNTEEGTTTVSSQPNGRGAEIESVDSAGSEQMIIRTTKEWNVRYEHP